VKSAFENAVRAIEARNNGSRPSEVTQTS
jgi:hypothetical protein